MLFLIQFCTNLFSQVLTLKGLLGQDKYLIVPLKKAYKQISTQKLQIIMHKEKKNTQF